MKSMISRLLGTRSRSRRVPARPIRRTPLRLEALDDRVMPSVTASVEGTQLFLVGDSSNDNISVNNAVPGPLALSSDLLVIANFRDGMPVNSFRGIKSVVMISGGGVDSFTNDSSVDARFVGTNGRVTMNGGTGRNVFVADGDD